jgi:hypothetical protein
VVFNKDPNLAEIREFAFERSGIRQFAFPARLQTIRATAFASLLWRVEFKIDWNHPVFVLDPKKAFLCEMVKSVREFGVPKQFEDAKKREYKRAIQFIGCDSTASVTSFVDSIGPRCFCGAEQLQAVSFDGSKLLAVEDEGFAETRISEITLPSSVVKIGKDALPLECRVSMVSPNPRFAEWCRERLRDPSQEFCL